MDEFAAALITRIEQARAALRAAAEPPDSLAVTQAREELESALQLAGENGIAVPPDDDGSPDRQRR